MSRWRILLILVLALAPFVALSGFGSYYLWLSGWSFWSWWPMATCWALAYALAWYWHRHLKLLGRPDVAVPRHWTERDQQAWQIVEARARHPGDLKTGQVAELHFYLDTAQELALELARVYHPGAADPLGNVTVPEILGVIELASHDLAELVDQFLPGSHLLTIRNWGQARQAADWYQHASSAYWLISAFFSPLETGLRFGAARVGMSTPWRQLQQDLVTWFYAAYIQRLGTYLIELNSGRLKLGATRYRELLRVERGGAVQPDHAPDTADHSTVTITVLGQVKVGKSSLINAILGEQRAKVDVIPATAEITHYDLRLDAPKARLQFLDTAGYGHAGPGPDQVKETAEAAQQSDLLILVLHARNPARSADVRMLEDLRRWFKARPEAKMPQVLGVMTHIDLLAPAMEWSPPYNWLDPERPKERQIHEALEAVRTQLGDFLAGCVPMCTCSGQVYGVEEWFLPTLIELLDDAKGVAILRCLRAEAGKGKVRKLFRQVQAAAGGLARRWWTRRPPPSM
jgi:predicted GTPase